jgi:hypothetical protein
MYQAPSMIRPDVFRVFVTANPTVFGTQPADDFSQTAHGLASATRNIPRDATAFSSEPTKKSWTDHINDRQKNGGNLP